MMIKINFFFLFVGVLEFLEKYPKTMDYFYLFNLSIKGKNQSFDLFLIDFKNQSNRQNHVSSSITRLLFLLLFLINLIVVEEWLKVN